MDDRTDKGMVGGEGRLDESLPVLAVLAGLLVVASVTSWGEPIANAGDPGFDQVYRAVAGAAFCVGLAYALMFGLGFLRRERRARLAAAVQLGKAVSP